MDSETQKVYSEGETLSDYIKTKAWKIVKEKFTNKMMDLQSVLNVKNTNPSDMAIEVQARQLAASYLYEIIREVEGDAAKFDSNKSLMGDVQIIE